MRPEIADSAAGLKIDFRPLHRDLCFRGAAIEQADVGELFNGQIGPPPKGMAPGLGGEVVLSAVDARVRKPDGSYGWDGAFGTYWWVNRKEQMVTVFFLQTSGRTLHYDFDNAVAQAVIE